MHKMLGQRQSVTLGGKHGAIGHPAIGKADARVICGHVKGPQIFFNLDARITGWNQKAGNAARIAVIAGRAAEQGAVAGLVHARGPHFFAIDQPALDPIAGLAHGRGFHKGGVRAVIGFGQAKGWPKLSGHHERDQGVALLGRAKIAQHQHKRVIADNRMLVLQIIMQAKALGGQMLADHGHPKIRAVLPAKFLG